MKKKSILAILIAVLCLSSVCFTACSGYDGQTPQDILENVYGDTEYTISFVAEDADAPVADMTYTAKNMPTLPVPTRVGYVFSGWYFDSSYTMPYSDGILYLYMRDVVLYAKWEQESFSADGTYDIDYSASVVDGTLVLGELAEEYGYKNFADDIVADETYIEKTDDQLLLKIQYDCRALEPLSLSDYKSYEVTLASALNDSDIYIADTVDSYTDTIKTLYIDITGMDLSTPIYFNISTINWETEGLTDEQRLATQTTYTIEFSVERMIGFSRPFEDTSVPLEDGYYLVRNYMSQLDMSETMMDSFNPVYSYIVAEGGNYTLVKPVYPYFGITEYYLGELLEPLAANYYDRMATFMPWQVCYEVDISDYEGQTGVESDYYPETYNAGRYKEYSVEFHAETGNCYSIIDLGDNLRTALVLSGSPTGFMEVAVDLGEMHTLMTIDYEHIVKLTSIDYEPLEGDAFVAEEEIQYYPGDIDDLNERGKTFDATEEYGLSTRMINYFFTATGLNSSYQSRTAYDSRITVAPTASTNAQTVANSRYNIAYFSVSSEIFGYDPTVAAECGEKLYYDSMTLGTFTSANMREFDEYRLGKSYRAGQSVVLSELYAEKVDADADFNAVSWQAYRMVNGEPDFSQPVSVDGSFVMEESVAILFSSGSAGNRRISLVEAVLHEEPQISVDGWTLSGGSDNVYVPDEVILSGEEYSYPTVTYTWGTVSGSFIGDYYDSGTSGLNTLHVAFYTIENGAYYLYSIARETLTFTMTTDYRLVVYELTNIYGERYYVYFEYEASGASERNYTVTDDEYGTGTVYDSGEFEEDTSGALLGAEASATGYLDSENYLDQLLREYYLHTSSGDYRFALSYYRLYLDGNSSEYSADEMTEGLAKQLWQSISQSNFAVLTLNYTRGEHSFTMRYVARITFSGNRDFRSVDEEDYFTGYEYTFIRPYVYDMEGNSLGALTVSAAKYASLDSNEVLNNVQSARAVRLSLSGQQYSMTFSETGKYRLTYTFSISLSSTERVSFTLTQDVYVLDGQGEVSVTYVTDEEHPFSDEIMRDAVDYTFADGSKGYAYTQTYSLLQAIQTFGSSSFASSADVFFGWSMEENGSARAASVISAGYSITDFISRFGDSDPVVYAIWDPGITVTAVVNGQTQQRTLYMNSSGVYVVDFSSFQALAPSGYNFVGWTGGFLGQSIVTGRYTIDAVDYDDPDLAEYLTITAEFRERLLVSYSIDSQYSNSFFLREEVNDGYYVSGVKTPVAKDGYTFVGWYIAVVNADGTITGIGEIFDLANDTVDSELCNSTGTAIGSTYKMLQLVAVFEDAEGNLVW